jgi:hypothetical protein
MLLPPRGEESLHQLEDEAVGSRVSTSPRKNFCSRSYAPRPARNRSISERTMGVNGSTHQLKRIRQIEKNSRFRTSTPISIGRLAGVEILQGHRGGSWPRFRTADEWPGHNPFTLPGLGSSQLRWGA